MKLFNTGMRTWQWLLALPLWISPLQADWSIYGMDWSFNQALVANSSTNTYTTNFNLFNPVAIAISPDATTGYIINENTTSGTLDIVNLTTNTITTTLPIQVPILQDVVPFAIAVSANGDIVYISARDTINDMSYLISFNTTTQVFSSYQLGSGQNVYSVAVNLAGDKVYITLSNGVAVFDVPTLSVVTTIPNIFGASRMAITPNQAFAYVTSSQNRLFKINLNTNIATEIAVPAASFPENIAMSPDGSKAFLANGGINDASVVDLATDTITLLPLGLSQQGVSVNPDSKTVFFSHIYTGTPGFSSVDVATSVITYIPTPGFPGYSGITPDQAPVSSFVTTVAPEGMPTNFTSTSTTPTGTIASYYWDFGDGVTEITLTPTTSHTYLFSGLYAATLNVTNSAGTSTFKTFTGQTLSNNGGPSASSVSLFNIPAAVATINPPVFKEGLRVKNKFLLQKNYADKLEWTIPTSGTIPAGYRIYSDAGLTNLLGTVKAENDSSKSSNTDTTFYKFFGKDVGKNSVNTYYIVSFSASNVSSAPLVIVVGP